MSEPTIPPARRIVRYRKLLSAGAERWEVEFRQSDKEFSLQVASADSEAAALALADRAHRGEFDWVEVVPQ